MLSTVLHVTAALVLLAVFIDALTHKVRDMAEFRRALLAYELLPVSMTGVVSWCVVVLEAAAISEIVLSLGSSRYLAAALLLVYTVGIGINLLRGRIALDCGCGSAPTPISVALVVRNVALAAMALGPSGVLQLQVAPLLLGLAMAGFITVLYFTANQLLANSSALKGSL